MVKQPPRRYQGLLYIEGILIPYINVNLVSQINKSAMLKADLPFIPELITKFKIEEIQEEEDVEETVDDEIELPAPVEDEDDPLADEEPSLEETISIEASGIQPYSIVHFFIKDTNSGEETLMFEGRIIAVGRMASRNRGAGISIQASASILFLEDMQMFMVELTRGLSVSSGFSYDRDGTASTSTVISTLSDKGLCEGIKELLKKAGNGANDFCNLTWRLMRYEQKLVVIENPKATGYWSGSDNLRKILEKVLGQIPNRQGVIQLLMTTLNIIKYKMVNVLAPSFLNATLADDDQPIFTPSLSEITTVEGSKLMTNDLVMMPNMDFAPPPRCNVLFPCQYEALQYNENFQARPTRAFGRISGSGAVRESDTSNLLIVPEEISEGVRAHGQYWSSPEERYRGHIMTPVNYGRPEYINELGSDYIKGFLNMAYETLKYQGADLQIINGAFNPSPIVGMPMLVLSKDGSHFLATLASITHSFTAQQAEATGYALQLARPYDVKPPDSATDLWFDFDFYARQHIGTRIYPQILGTDYAYSLLEPEQPLESTFMTVAEAKAAGYTIIEPLADDEIINIEDYEMGATTTDTSEGDTSSGLDTTDLSILKILAALGLTNTEIEEAKSAPESIKNAADAIYTEYRNSGNLDMYAHSFGRRMPIGRKQLFNTYYGARVSQDLFSCAGGYTVATNSLTLRDNTEVDKEVGEPIPEEYDIGGCFFREKQDAILYAANYLLGMARSGIATTAEGTTGITTGVTLVGPNPEEIAGDEAAMTEEPISIMPIQAGPPE